MSAPSSKSKASTTFLFYARRILTARWPRKSASPSSARIPQSHPTLEISQHNAPVGPTFDREAEGINDPVAHEGFNDSAAGIASSTPLLPSEITGDWVRSTKSY